MKNRISAFVVVMMAALLLTMGGCKDFFGTEDLKETIRADAQVATAAEIQIVLRAESDSMGVPSPYGTQTVKVGVPFEITTTVGQDYSFLAWTHSGESGIVEFADSSSVSTLVTVTEEVTDLLISPTFDRRPYPVAWDPYSGNTGVVTNKTVSLTFNEPLDAETVVLAEGASVQVSTWPKTGGAEAAENPDHLEEFLTLSVEGRVITIAPDRGYWFEPFHTVLLELSDSITDADGNAMAEPFSWFFSTGNGQDDEPPVITDFTIRGAQGVSYDENEDEAFTNGATITITVVAVDELQEVPYLEVRETFGGGDPVVTPYTLAGPVEYTMQRSGDGESLIEIRVADSLENWTEIVGDSYDTKSVYLDTLAPSVNVGTITTSGNPGYVTNGQTITIPFTITESGAGLTAAPVVKIGGQTAEVTGTHPNYEASHTFSGTAVAEGTIGYTIDAADKADNTMPQKSGSTGILYDRSAPSIASLTVNGGTYYTNDRTDLSVAHGAISASGASVTGYRVYDSGSTPPAFAGSDPTEVDLADSDGERNVRYEVQDAAGNVGVATDTVYLDRVAPSIPSFNVNGGDYYTNDRTDVPIAHGAITYTGAPVDGYRVYDVADTPPAFGGSDPGSVDLTDSEGEHTVRYQVRDQAGNVATSDDTVYLDRVAPSFTSVTVNGGNPYTNQVDDVPLSAVFSVSGAPLDQYRVYQQGTTPPAYSGSEPTSVDLSGGDGLKTIVYEVIDAAGNPASDNSGQVTLDRVGPTVASLTVNGGDYYTNDRTDVPITHGAISVDGAPVTGYRVYDVADTPPAFSGIDPITVDLADFDGEHTVRYEVEDEAENVGFVTDTVYLDRAVPTISLGVGGVTSTTVSLDTVDSAGIKEYTVVSGSATYDASGLSALTPPTIGSPNTYQITATDNADNTTGTYEVEHSYDGEFYLATLTPP